MSAGIIRRLFAAAGGFVALVAMGTPSMLSDRDMAKVDFAAECTTVSDPLNRLLFEHEELVNSFLNVPGKFGLSRAMTLHLSNARLANHGGTARSPGGWQEGGHRYTCHPGWGLIGGVEDREEKVFFFSQFSYMGTQKAATPITPSRAVSPYMKGVLPFLPPPANERPTERAADPFEIYALNLLRKGEALVRWEREDIMRAVGAIRAGAVCLKCHEGAREGDVLGAFTYQFSKCKPDAPLAQSEGDAMFRRRVDKDIKRRVVSLASEGRTLDEVSRILESQEAQRLGRDFRLGPYGVRSLLLDAGVVTSEMAREQANDRKQLVEFLPQWMSPNKPRR